MNYLLLTLKKKKNTEEENPSNEPPLSLCSNMYRSHTHKKNIYFQIKKNHPAISKGSIIYKFFFFFALHCYENDFYVVYNFLRFLISRMNKNERKKKNSIGMRRYFMHQFVLLYIYIFFFHFVVVPVVSFTRHIIWWWTWALTRHYPLLFYEMFNFGCLWLGFLFCVGDTHKKKQTHTHNKRMKN